MISIGFPAGGEWLIVLVVVLLLFGHRLPGMARSLGSGITEFKRGLRDGSKEGSGSEGGKSPTADDSSTPKA